uniref:Pancreatic progenitor cell differentiation and proliferation factor b n=1 Tax=Cyprinus carpio carpio TaxID=630221 RepID=A0A9J7YFQ2_CYPCA
IEKGALITSARAAKEGFPSKSLFKSVKWQPSHLVALWLLLTTTTETSFSGRIGSTSSSSSCGSSEYSGEVIPHHPGLPKQDSGHWWSSFFFGKQNQPGMGTLTEEAQQKSGVMSVTNGQVTCIAREMVMRQVSESSDGGKSEAGSSPHS